MQPTATFLTTITAAPYLHLDLLLKRDSVVCGNLENAYSFARAPVCSGQSSICTFVNGFQGCCDSNQSCLLYTSCNGPQAPVSCTDTRCLQCPSSAPYCTKYNFFDGTRAYDGFSCGNINIGTTTIFGSAGSVALAATFTSSSPSSASTTSAQSSASTAGSPSRSTASSGSLTSSQSSSTNQQSSVSSSAAASASSTAETGTQVRSSTHPGAIAGGIVGGVVFLALLAAAIWWFVKKRGSDSMSDYRRDSRMLDAPGAREPPPYGMA